MADDLDAQLDQAAQQLGERERARVDYIASLVMEEREALCAAFHEQDAKLLFDKTASSLWLMDYYTTSLVRMRYPLKFSPLALQWDALVRLGWAMRYPLPVPNPDGTHSYVPWPTQRGMKLLDGLRAAAGDPSVSAQVQANRAAWSERAAPTL